MKVEIICVGTELLLGDILNTNAKFLSGRLAEMGFNVYSQSTVGDNAERLENQLKISMYRSDIIILCGGLGPTEDDITKETVAKFLNLPLEQDEETLKNIKAYFSRTGRAMSENNKKQALKIKGSTLLKNLHGTAPGAYVEVYNGAVILLPGPPKELEPMFNEQLVPILKKFTNGTIYSRNIRLFGIGESAAAELCGELLNGSNPTVATYAKTGEVDIRVTASAKNHQEARALCKPIVNKLVDMFGDHVYGVDVENLQQKVVQLLKVKDLKLSTAESCTAGMLSERITEVPGSSDVFEMGVVAYANYVKVQALCVDQALIDEKGAVSAEVAAQMAIGIRSLCGSDIGVGITGVAGPGQTENKPAGLVYIALADAKNIFVRKILSRGTDRDTTRILATSTALDMVRRYLENCEDFISFGTNYGEPLKLMEGYELNKTESLLKSENKVARKTENILSNEEVANLFYVPTQDEKEYVKINDELKNVNESINFIIDDDFYTTESTNNAFSDLSESDKGENSDQEIKSANKAETLSDKQNKKSNFLCSFLPKKSDSSFEKIRKSIFIIAFLVLICTTIYLVNYFAEGWRAQDKITSAAEVWQTKGSMQKNENDIFVGFEELKKQNKDIRAWIKIEGTNINTPVYQTTNNEFYINHDMAKQQSRYGALFIDKNAKIERDYNSKNVVVYGHHMKDGTMFAALKKYTDISFYKEHSVIDFKTLFRDGQYKIFSVFITNTLAEHDDGKIFDYCDHNFKNAETFLNFVDEVKKRSIIDTGVDVLEGDEILTLSTCTYEFEEARLVVIARKIRKGETNVTNTNDAKINKAPLYPQIWYDMRGGKKPVFESKVETSSNVVSSSDISGVSSGLEHENGVSSGANEGTISTEQTATSTTTSTATPSSSETENTNNNETTTSNNSDQIQ